MRRSTVTAIVFALVLYMGIQVQSGDGGGDPSIRAALLVAAVAAFFAWRRLPS